MKQSVHHFWQSRQPREQALLLLCLVVACVALLYSARQGAVAWQQRAWQQMQQLEARMQAVLPARPDIATLNQLTGLSLQPGANGALIASAGSVEFKPLINVLISLEQQQRLQATRLRLERQETRLRLTLLELNDVR
ncbi:type II secretion system protein [Erwinia aphidicola]|uniref:type II secretion system protein n=1 Tax=Erwinia aphidicola TaxID=68334 RepID=UPI0030D344E3